ncbi:MAG TPA: hypothetical protein VFK32_02800, partial [Tepidiformaceae bacterium]|nr:hypothetical protein [Tepidiformaceae bacterium]
MNGQLAMGFEAEAPTGPPALGAVRKVTYVHSRSVLTKPSGAAVAHDFTLNPYTGCGFACDYCYARFFRPEAYERDTWGEWVTVKRNAVALVRRAVRAGQVMRGTTLFMSSVTDPYQPIESKLGLTRSVVEALLPV